MQWLMRCCCCCCYASLVDAAIMYWSTGSCWASDGVCKNFDEDGSGRRKRKRLTACSL